MRVRRFELRLIAVALVVCWSVAAGLVLLAYRPGGPFDLIVGFLAMTPVAIALAGVIWPPVARGDHAFPATVWLGILALLCLVPSIAGVLTQLLSFGSRTLLPSFEAAYPWLIALLATSLFSGYGIARRLDGGTALRRRRLVAGTAIALVATLAASISFAAVAVANDIALRDTPADASRFGPTSGAEQPPLCDAPLVVGPSARLAMHLDATVDLRPIGSVELTGLRVGDDFRWLAYVASDRQLGQYGSARIGDAAWLLSPGHDWQRADPAQTAGESVDQQALAIALSPDYRATAEDRGVEVIEGARARRCRIAVDGATFAAAFPEATWLVGPADLHRWRGQLDYWIFLDGQLGQVAGSANGEAAGIVPAALNGTIDVRLTATERGRDPVVYPPSP
ncbi:MAG TPA: hypothetical protein VGQ31_14610 [Candidatus Limnocylindrales bacterium]|jgi:hypothetical protein|nr:hypothetical protein [Candidatus Limnocylindrales bacterium]